MKVRILPNDPDVRMPWKILIPRHNNASTFFLEALFTRFKDFATTSELVPILTDDDYFHFGIVGLQRIDLLIIQLEINKKIKP